MRQHGGKQTQKHIHNAAHRGPGALPPWGVRGIAVQTIFYGHRVHRRNSVVAKVIQKLMGAAVERGARLVIGTVEGVETRATNTACSP